MTNGAVKAIAYDPGSAFYPGRVTSEDLENLAPQLEAARREILETDAQLYESGEIPADKQPLDHGFIGLPRRLLEEYQADRAGSELGQILTCAERISAAVDRVVVLGIGGSYMGARALLESCCHPYHNELSRAERGGRPRMYFEGNNVDNDAAAGLLDLLPRDAAGAVDKQWGVVVISKSGGTRETAIALRIFLRALRDSVGGDSDRVAELLVPVTGREGKLDDLQREIGCRDVFRVPDGVGGRFSVLSAVGLLPAAILGLDIVKLLEGAVAMNERFANSPPGDNPVLDYVGVSHLLEDKQGADVRILSSWTKSLEAFGLWYDQLLSESLGKQGRGALPLTVVNTRDLHSRGQQHQEGARDKVITNLIVENWRRDPLAVGESELNQDGLNEIADKTLPQVMTAAIQGTNRAYNDDERPTADLRLPHVAEDVLGQLFQMFMLATAIEGRLIGINPYGQPGVEAYKRNMNELLAAK